MALIRKPSQYYVYNFMIILRTNTYSFQEDERKFQRANRRILGHGLMTGIDAGIAGALGKNVIRGGIKNNKLSALGAGLGSLGAGYHAYKLGKNIQTSRNIYRNPEFKDKYVKETYQEIIDSDRKSLYDIIDSRKDIKTGRGASDRDIRDAERKLDLNFSDDYIWYLKKYGWLSSKKGILTGISPDKKFCVIANTEAARKEFGNLMPRNAYVVGKVGNSVLYQTASSDVTKLERGKLPKLVADWIGYLFYDRL